jgi:hypothetical protein
VLLGISSQRYITLHDIATVILARWSVANYLKSYRAYLTILQPAFTALNVEPEETVVEEVDTTRELQVRAHPHSPLFFEC